MKKKNLSKKLSLSKKQISNLSNVNGGALPQSHLTCTIDPAGCGGSNDWNCTSYSELRTACECVPTQNQNCPSWGIICPVESKDVCEA